MDRSRKSRGGEAKRGRKIRRLQKEKFQRGRKRWITVSSPSKKKRKKEEKSGRVSNRGEEEYQRMSSGEGVGKKKGAIKGDSSKRGQQKVGKRAKKNFDLGGGEGRLGRKLVRKDLKISSAKDLPSKTERKGEGLGRECPGKRRDQANKRRGATSERIV